MNRLKKKYDNGDSDEYPRLNEIKNKYLIKKILTIIFFILIVVIILLFYYFKILERWSKPIIKREMNYIIQVEKFEDRNVFIVSPNESEDISKIILFLHGGAYVEEMSANYWDFIEKMANDANAMIVIPDYPLAPKYNYEDVFNMIKPLYQELINKVDANNVVLMGDSAGGGMALALLEKLNEENITNPSKSILISPWLDVSMENSKIDEIQKKDNILKKDVLKLAGIAYAKKEENIKDYLVSPIYGDISKLKNITIFTGTFDILNPDVHTLIEKANSQGVEIDLKEYEGAKHIWLIENNSSDEVTDKAYSELIESIV